MLERNYSKKDFIRAYNYFSDVGNEFHLTDEEFYIYCFLFTKRMIDESIETSGNSINYYLKNFFYKKEDLNKKHALKIIKSLINKKVFILQNDVNLDKFRNDTVIILTINDKELSGSNEKEEGFKNFSQIPYIKFTEFKNARDAYIYSVVNRWLKGARYSYSTWAEILQCSLATAKRNIKEAIDNEIIYVNVGNYLENGEGSQKHQETNTYHIKPITQIEKTAQTKKKESENNVDGAIDLFKDKKKSKKQTPMQQFSFDIGLWLETDKNKYLDVDDFEIYYDALEKAETNDEYKEFIVLCDRRIDAISKSIKGKENIDKKIKQALENIESRKQHNLGVNSLANTHLDYLNGVEDYNFGIIDDDFDIDDYDEWVNEQQSKAN